MCVASADPGSPHWSGVKSVGATSWNAFHQQSQISNLDAELDQRPSQLDAEMAAGCGGGGCHVASAEANGAFGVIYIEAIFPN